MNRTQILAAIEACNKEMDRLRAEKPNGWQDNLGAQSLAHAALHRDLAARDSAIAAANVDPSAPLSPEDAEFSALARAVNVGDIFAAAMTNRETDGPARELQQQRGVESNVVPLDVLRIENAVTPAPGTVGINEQALTGQVFPQAVAAFLGIPMPRVASGEALYPILTSETVAAVPAENAEAAETDGTFTADALAPKRIQASFFYSREDAARFTSMGSGLRQNLTEALAAGLDKQVISGTSGLLTGVILANNNVSAVTTFANYLSNFAYGRIDGKYAGALRDIRIVVGSETHAHLGTVYRGNNADFNGADALIRATSGLRVSAHVPAAAGNKQNALIRLGMRQDFVVPVWEGVTLIPDQITKAKSGQVVITAIMLHAVKLLRSGGFYKQQSQHA